MCCNSGDSDLLQRVTQCGYESTMRVNARSQKVVVDIIIIYLEENH